VITEMVYQHECASMPLRYGLDVTCNTDDDVILSNVLINARKVKRWAKSLPPNDKTLLICGSGPSIADDVELIRDLYGSGAHVWGLNNCANYLGTLGIAPDAQVIMDAQEHNLKAIAPAKSHLFASQCHPAMFDAVPDAILWHSTHGETKVDEQAGFPSHDDEYCLIGSAVSVGNTALVLAYSLGYRNIHLFGYDSSNKGVSHVIHQEWNDGEPMTIVEFRGKKYECSLTMRLQADAFGSRASVLIREGCKVTVHGYGLLPDRWNADLTEQEKYELMWSRGDYGLISPGEQVAERFISVVAPKQGARIADFGCGSGKGSLAIDRLGKFDITCIDFTENSRDDEAQKFQFIKADLSGGHIPVYVNHGFCTDVLEHIPTDKVDATIIHIMEACHDCFFQISTIPDDFGGAIGRPLHLTVKPHSWWKEKFISLGYAVRWEEDQISAALFHIFPQQEN